MGVNPTAWGYSPDDDIMNTLIAEGVPAGHIAAIGDAESDSKKQALFEKMRQGSVRLMMGSTQKMGNETNVQKRLVALHHLDALWKPAKVEQRDGRQPNPKCVTPIRAGRPFFIRVSAAVVGPPRGRTEAR
jgi:hypothetical protein